MRRERRRVGAAFVGCLAIVLLAALALHVGGISGKGSGAQRNATAAAHGRHPGETLAVPTRSRLGKTLGKPPLHLSPATGSEALQIPFHHPPRAGLVFNLDTGRVLWQRDATRILPIASLTKMMTALLVVRSLPADAHVLVTRRAVRTAGSKVGVLPAGKHVGLETLLYGLLLPSGNDAAVALAEAVAGSEARFVREMNDEAAELGLGCTRYVSPDGIENANTSCAADLAVLARADLDESQIARVTASASAVEPLPIKGGKVWLYNNNPLLRYGYPGTTGLKTGETEAAGLCLVGTAERRGVRLGVVLLHSPELGRQAAEALDAAFTRVYHQPLPPEPVIPKGA